MYVLQVFVQSWTSFVMFLAKNVFWKMCCIFDASKWQKDIFWWRCRRNFFVKSSGRQHCSLRAGIVFILHKMPLIKIKSLHFFPVSTTFIIWLRYSSCLWRTDKFCCISYGNSVNTCFRNLWIVGWICSGIAKSSGKKLREIAPWMKGWWSNFKLGVSLELFKGVVP